MTRVGLWAAALFVMLSISSQVWADPTGDQRGPGMMWEWGWYGMFLGPLVMILFVAAIVVVVVLIIRWLGGAGHGSATSPGPAPGKTPLDILKERFARGEIDKEEFEERRRVLGE